MQDLTPLRPAFWNVPLWAEIGVYVIGIAAVVLCIAGIVRAVKQRQATTQPEPLADRNARLGRTLLEVFWQKRIRDTAAGKNHFVLFWGFIFLFFGTAIATIDWDIAWLVFGKRILSGNIYLAYKFVLDLAGLLALIALGFSFWRRFISHDPKVEANWRFALVLGSLAFIILTGFLLEALRLAVQQPQWAGVSFVGNALAQIFIGTDPETLKVYHTFIWVIHGLASLGFIASIPLTSSRPRLRSTSRNPNRAVRLPKSKTLKNRNVSAFPNSASSVALIASASTAAPNADAAPPCVRLPPRVHLWIPRLSSYRSRPA